MDVAAAGGPLPPGDAPLDTVDAAIVSSLLASAPVGFALIDSDLRYVRINDLLAEFNGGDPAGEQIGRYVFDVVPGLRDGLEPCFETVLQTGQALRNVEISGTTEAEPGVVRHWLATFFPVRIPGGELHGIGVLAVEISERKRLEEVVASIAGQLNAVLSAAPVGIAVVDRDHRYVIINDAMAEMDALPADEHLGERIEDVFPDERGRLFARWIDHVLDRGEPLTDIEIDGPDRAGRHQESLAYYYPVERGGEITGVGMAIVDVTERNRLLRSTQDLMRERIDAQRQALDELQRMLLPALPQRDDLRVAARYLPAEAIARVGGDWYDCFEAPDGRIVASVGDAIGHGVRAVSIMDRARNAIRTLLIAGQPLPDAMGYVNEVLAEGDSGIASACVLALDPATGATEVVVAGHPPPLVSRAAGGVETLDGRSGMLLGVQRGTGYASFTTTLDLGDTIAIYTDGLVERRSETIDDGVARLARALQGVDGADDAAIDRLIDVVLRGRDRDDDACLLVLSRTSS